MSKEHVEDKKPYLNANGDLVIPFECADHSFKYWKQEGRTLGEILRELGASREVWEKYTFDDYEGNGDGL